MGPRRADRTGTAEKVKALSERWKGPRTILFEQKHRGEAGRTMLPVSDFPKMKEATGSNGGSGWRRQSSSSLPHAFARAQQGPSRELSHFLRPPSLHHPSLLVTCLCSGGQSDPHQKPPFARGLCTVVTRLRFTSKLGQHVLTASVCCRPAPGAATVLR